PFTAQAAQGCRAAPTSREAPSWPWQHGSAPPGRRRGGPGGAVACGRPVPARFRLRGPGGGPRGAGEAHAARPEGGRGRREHAAAARVSTTGRSLRVAGASRELPPEARPPGAFGPEARPPAPKHAAAAAPKGKGATAAVRQEAGAGLAFARGGAGARAAGPAPRAAGASRGEDLLGQRHGGYVAFGSG
ncbi:unnamed protein product, partial [Prorocentrum cordatum]